MELSIARISPAIHFVSIWNNNDGEARSAEKHTCTYRILYTKQGSCRVLIGGTEFRVPERSAFWFLPGLSYTTIVDPTQKTEILNIGFDLCIGNRTLPQNAITNKNLYLRKQSALLTPLYRFTDCELLNTPAVLTVAPETERLFEKILREKRELRPLCIELVNAYLQEIVLLAVRDSTYPQQASVSDAARLIIQYVHQHIGEPLSNEQAAHDLCYHPNYISRVVKQTTGMSFHRYVNHEKLHRAADLLLDSNATVTEIAETLSFQSSSHFAKRFSEEFGMSPSVWRKQYS